jgi:hypothetical protein
MVGLALVSAVAVLGASLKESVSAVVERSFAADFVLTSQSFQGFSPTVVERLREAEELDAVLGVRTASPAGRRRADQRRQRAGPGGGARGAARRGGRRRTWPRSTRAGSRSAPTWPSSSVCRSATKVPATWADTGRRAGVGAVYEPNEFLT